MARTFIRHVAQKFARLLLLNLLFVLLASPLGAAHGAILTCETGVASLAVLDPSATSAQVGDIAVACTGTVSDPSLTVSIQSFYSVALLQDTVPVLDDGTNTYLGGFANFNSIAFSSIPLSVFDGSFTIGSVFVDPSALAPGLLITELLSVAGEVFVPIKNPVGTVAIVGDVATSVPEPASALLLGAGCAALMWFRRRRELRPGEGI